MILILSIATVWSLLMALYMVWCYGAKAQGGNWIKILHDFILNFVGVFLGWASLGYVLLRLSSGAVLEVADTIILIIAFAGITGYLPHLVINKGFGRT